MPRGKQTTRKNGSYDKDGILYQRTPTSKCYFIYYTGEKDENGKPIRPWIDLETTDKKEAKEKIKNIRADLARKGRYDPPTDQTVSEWLDFWLDEIVNPNLKSINQHNEKGSSTYDFYEYLIRLHLKPKLGKIPLKKLTPEEIQKFLNQKRTEKKLSRKKDDKDNYIPSNELLSKRTLHGIEDVLSRALKKAVALRKIPDNPMIAIDRTKYKREKVKYMDMEQVAEFLDKISYDQWYFVFLTTLGTGIRLSELSALKWDDVDLVNKTIRIDEGRVEVKTHEKEGPKTKIITKDPKSDKGKRVIPLPDDVVIGLKKWREIQIQERWDWEKKRLKEEEYYKEGKFVNRKYKREEYCQSGYVFTKKDGYPPRPDRLSKHFLELTRRHGLEGLSFHKQRHSYASMLLEAGEDMKVIQENLGDSTLQVVSDTYTHVAEKLQRKAAEKLNGFATIKRKKQINSPG
jgi:integrase